MTWLGKRAREGGHPRTRSALQKGNGADAPVYTERSRAYRPPNQAPRGIAAIAASTGPGQAGNAAATLSPDSLGATPPNGENNQLIQMLELLARLSRRLPYQCRRDPS